MEAGRITTRPRPSNGLRILANKLAVGNYDGFLNTFKMLQRREIGSKRDRRFTIRDAQEIRFRNMFLQEEFNTHDSEGQFGVVFQIVSASDIVFALLHSGVCAAFSRETNQRICFLNMRSDEFIRRIFYNKNNDSVITVSGSEEDGFNLLKCRSTRMEYIRRGQLDAGVSIFNSEPLKWPGVVEFDDVNGKVLTFSTEDRIYKVFDLINYTKLYSISDKDIQNIKISPGTMLLIYKKFRSRVPLKILSIGDGSVLKSFNHLLYSNKQVDFIELFNEKLLVKQKDENLQILDIRTSELTEVSRTAFMTPSAFIFLHEKQLFLTFEDQTVAVWNFRGEPVTTFDDHLLWWHPYSNMESDYITSEQDLIISYCKADSSEQADSEQDDPDLVSDELLAGAIQNAGSINISNILTGKCLAKINVDNTRRLKDCKCSGGTCNLSKSIQASKVTSTVAEALENVTAIFYDEERNEIYTGNYAGLLHVWSS